MRHLFGGIWLSSKSWLSPLRRLNLLAVCIAYHLVSLKVTCVGAAILREHRQLQVPGAVLKALAFARHAEVCWVCTVRHRALNQDVQCSRVFSLVTRIRGAPCATRSWARLRAICLGSYRQVLLTNEPPSCLTPTDLIGLNHERPWIYFADDTIRRAVLQLLGYRCQIEGTEAREPAASTHR